MSKFSEPTDLKELILWSRVIYGLGECGEVFKIRAKELAQRLPNDLIKVYSDNLIEFNMIKDDISLDEREFINHMSIGYQFFKKELLQMIDEEFSNFVR